MPRDLKDRRNHPVNAVAEWEDSLPMGHAERPGGIRAQEILQGVEQEESVTYVALHNDDLLRIRRAHEDIEAAPSLAAANVIREETMDLVFTMLGVT